MAVLVATFFVANGFGHSHRSAMRQAFMITPETLLGSVRYLSPRQSVSEEKKPHRIIQHDWWLRASA